MPDGATRPAETTASAGAHGLFTGPGESRARCRDLDWAATALGPVAQWPASLRSTATTVLALGFPSIVLWGPELVQIYNDAYIPFLGVKHPAALGLGCRACWPEVWPALAPILARALAGETVTLTDQHYPLYRRGADAPPDDVYITLSYVPVRDDAGGIGGVLVTGVDTSAQVRMQRFQAEQARVGDVGGVERTRVLEEIFRTAPSFLHVLHGPDFVLEFINDAYYQLVGYRDLLGRPAFEAMPESAAGGFQARIARVMTTGEPFYGRELPVTVARTPGAPPEERFIDLVYLPLYDADGSCTRVLGHGYDVTEQVRTRRAVERRIAERTAELAAVNAAFEAEATERARGEGERTMLRRQLADAEEAERRRIARELHDQLGQHLTAFTWGLDEARRLTLADIEAHTQLAQRLAQLQDLAGVMTRDARYLALQLRPAELDDVGLESALETYVDQWAARYGVAAEVAVTGLTDRSVPTDVGSALYRIVQEALTNVVKHAAARHVSVIVEKPDGEVRLIVEDDGRGFDVAAAQARPRAERRLGMAGMRERAALVGGTLTVESTLAHGTTLYVRVPLHGNHETSGDPASEPAPGAPLSSDTGG
jgi:signal transduction histidine kinase